MQLVFLEDANTTGQKELALSETTGSFIDGEQIIFNEKISTEKSSILKINTYTIDDINHFSK